MVIHLMRYFISRILIALIFITPILAEEKNDLHKLNKLNNKTYLGNRIFMKKYSKYLMKNKTSKILERFKN